MFKVIILSLIASALLLLPKEVQAEAHTSSEMEQAIKTLDTMSGQELCIEKWNVFWPLAKKGDLAARAYLAMSMGPMMHTDTTVPPGRSGDYVSRWRDVQIMTVHSLGASIGNVEGDEFFYSLANSILDRTLDHKFTQCVKEERYKECAAIAVDEKRVPPFDAYAMEIDAMIAQGLKPTCIEDGYQRPNIRTKE